MDHSNPVNFGAALIAAKQNGDTVGRNARSASSIVFLKRVRLFDTAYRARTVSSDSPSLSEVIRSSRNQRNWHGAAAAELGQGLAAPPELRTHDRLRINLAKAAELEASGGAG